MIRLSDNAENILKGRTQPGYSKVILNVTKDLYYESGNDTGMTLECDCPWGTQAIADTILAYIRGYEYQPFEAANALLDPAAEIGDTVSVKGIQSGIYSVSTDFSPLMSADIAAPAPEDIDSEYPFKPSADRKIERQIANVSSEIGQVADEVYANVVRKEGGSSQSFGWSLTADGFILTSNRSEVFRADANGITVSGTINAKQGYIGSGSTGFTISSKAIYSGISSQSASGNGVYIGTDGINLGGNFKVDRNGNITATSGTFSGAVYASSIKSDGVDGYGGSFSGSGLTSRSVGSGKVSSSINDSLGYADYAHSVFSGSVRANWIKASSGSLTSLAVNGYECGWIAATDRWGDNIYVLGRR